LNILNNIILKYQINNLYLLKYYLLYRIYYLNILRKNKYIMKTMAQIQIFLLYFYNIVFLANFSYSQLQEKKISDIDVLLPLCYSDNCDKVVHTVSAFGGCYEW